MTIWERLCEYSAIFRFTVLQVKLMRFFVW